MWVWRMLKSQLSIKFRPFRGLQLIFSDVSLKYDISQLAVNLFGQFATTIKESLNKPHQILLELLVCPSPLLTGDFVPGELGY